MGLDNYFRYPAGPGETAPNPTFEDPQPVLAGGMFSGHGTDGSFRGKIYADFVKKTTGTDLYQDIISGTELVSAAQEIEEWLANDANDPEEFGLPREHAVDLARCFRAFGEAGFNCISWY